MKPILLLLFPVFLAACGSGKEGPASGKDSAAGSKTAPADPADGATAGRKATDSATGAADVVTPVTVTTVSHGALNDYIELNAVSAFLQKSYVKANTNGYLQSADVYPGRYVEKGQLLFTLRTKEAQSIGNAINQLDSTLKFSGVNAIRSSQHGYITQLNHQSGDYVQDGEQLAAISDRNSFVFLLNLPYELRSSILHTKTVELLLPDGTRLNGTIGEVMPTVDSASQTQNVVIRVNGANSIPENLIATVRIPRSSSNNVQSIPKAALLTDETESDFWVMKMTGSTTAVRIPVKKGMETKDRVEILSPSFAPSDQLLLTGNYGLPDTAKVKIMSH